MDGSAYNGDGNLTLTFATWVYQLHAAGVPSVDEQVEALCTRVDEADSGEAGDEAGEALVERIAALLDGRHGPGGVAQVARDLYGDRVGTDFGAGDRSDRTTRIRKYQFGRSLPWLARIYERQDDRVAPSWLLVERVTDEVRAMDPNPWNDIDEERSMPLDDFLVLWDLDTCTSVYLR